MTRLFGCVEAGGTKFVVGVVAEDRTVLDEARFSTTTPDETLGAVAGWLQAARGRHGALAGLGIGSFGPLSLNKAAPDWGHITNTPKPGWAGCDLAGRLGGALNLPVAIDTDVNGAALAEWRWGAAQGKSSAVYLTVGTGIGGGAVVNGRLLHGVSHPEMGHIRLPRHADDAGFPGSCPIHGTCAEGLASGPAIIARWGASLSQLGPDHPAQAIIAWYLAQVVVTLQAIMEPACVIMGGGVMATPGLLDRVRAAATELGGGYFVGNPREVIVPPGLGTHAGLLGALALALDA